MYRNTKKGSPRYRKTFKLDNGVHVYNPGKPNEVRVGRPAAGRKNQRPNRQRPGSRQPGKQDQWNPLAPLTGQAMNQELEAATRLQFGETERELDFLRRQSLQHETNVGDWWGDYRREVASAEQRTRLGYQQAAAGVYAQGAAASGQDAATNAGVQGAAEQSAELRGAATDPSLAQEAGQAVSARQASVGTMGDLIAGQGANAGAYLANRGATASGIRAQARQDELRRRGEIDKERMGLVRKKGDYRTDFRNKARESERTYAAVQREFGLDQAEAQTDAQIDAAKLLDAQREAKADRRADRRDRRDDRSDERFDRNKENRKLQLDVAQERRMERDANKPSSGPTKFTTTQVRTARRDLRSAAALARDTGDAKPGRGKTLRQFLASKGYDDPILGRVAVEYAIYGGVVSKGLRGQFRREYGFAPRLKKAKKPSQGSPSMPWAR